MLSFQSKAREARGGPRVHLAARQRGRGMAIRGACAEPAIPVIGFLSSLAPHDLTQSLPLYGCELGDHASFLIGKFVMIKRISLIACNSLG